VAEFTHLQAQDLQRGEPSKPRRKERTSHDLVRLQRLAGNSDVSNLLLQRQDDAGAGDQSSPAAPAGGGAGMVVVGALERSATISYTLKNGQLVDASAQIKGTGG